MIIVSLFHHQSRCSASTTGLYRSSASLYPATCESPIIADIINDYLISDTQARERAEAFTPSSGHSKNR